MNPNLTFTIFTPISLFESTQLPEQLFRSFEETHLLVCGELHGIKQNADTLYSLAKALNIQTIALELHPEHQPFMQTVLRGQPDFSLIDSEILFGSVASVEMLKTVYVLYKEGLIASVELIDTDNENIEQGLADNLISLTPMRTLCVMGNWHTTLHESNDHISALQRARQKRPLTYIEYTYGKGTYYNIGTGLDAINNSLKESRIKITSTSPHTFKLVLPIVKAVAHDSSNSHT